MDFSNTPYSSYSDTGILSMFGEYIRHHRLSQNKTQQQVADAAGINRSTLSQLEHGAGATLTTLIQVLRVLNQLQLIQHFAVQTQLSPMQLAEAEIKLRKRARQTLPAPKDTSSDW